jgi:hypothetical protein
LINEANQVHDDLKNKFKNSEFNVVDASNILKIIFEEYKLDDQEISKINDLKNTLEHFFQNLSGDYPSKSKPYPSDYSITGNSGPFLYNLCRYIKPDVVVETGVAYRVSSSYILKALSENNNGKLISIDSIFRPWQSKEMIGSAIPINLRDRWELKIGSSEELIEKILKNLSSVDIFLHDSLHTYKNMNYEFQKSWPFISKGGFLLSDDVTINNAFNDFCKSVKKEPFMMIQHSDHLSYLGVLQK